MNHRDQENEYDDIDDFLQAIWLQKSLSDNTLAAYRRDLIKTERWLRGNSKNLVSASGIDLHEYMSNILHFSRQSVLNIYIYSKYPGRVN